MMFEQIHLICFLASRHISKKKTKRSLEEMKAAQRDKEKQQQEQQVAGASRIRNVSFVDETLRANASATSSTSVAIDMDEAGVSPLGVSASYLVTTGNSICTTTTNDSFECNE
jgi:hypothetical protein